MCGRFFVYVQDVLCAPQDGCVRLCMSEKDYGFRCVNICNIFTFNYLLMFTDVSQRVIGIQTKISDLFE